MISNSFVPVSFGSNLEQKPAFHARNENIYHLISTFQHTSYLYLFNIKSMSAKII